MACLSWSCTLRGISADGLDGLEGEPSLHALARDGRTIEGRVVCPDSPLCSEGPTVVELEGLGPLRIEGRELWGGRAG